MWRSLLEALQRFETDPNVRCVVIRGEGDRSFCAGADLSEKQGADQATAKAVMEQTLAGLRRLDAFTKPVLAMVFGHCMGAGLAIAVTCDVRLVAQGAQFGIPAARLGLAYNYSEIKRLVNLVGVSRAKRIVFTAERIDAARALQMGLVDEVVPGSELLATVKSMAASIAANAPLTIAAAKHAVALALRDPAGLDISASEDQARLCLASQDHAEGLLAFQQKRVPVFRGI